MNRRRLLIGIVVVVVVALITTFLALRSYFTEERILALLQPRLEQAIGRPVEVEGASLRAWPLSLSLRGVRVQDESSSSDAALLRLGELQCRVEAGALLRRRLLVQSLVIDSLYVSLRQSADSTWNFAPDATGGGTPGRAAKQPEAASTPMALTVRSLQVRRSVVEIDQPDRGLRIPLEADLQFDSDRDMRRVTLQGELRSNDLQGHGRLAGVQDVRLRLQPHVQIDVPDSSAHIDRLQLQVQDLTLDVAGDLQMRQGKPHGTLRSRSQELELVRVLSLVPRDMAPTLEDIEANGKVALDLTATLRGEATPQVQGSITLAGGRLQTPELPQPLEDLQIELQWSGDRITVQNTSLRFGDDRFRASGTIEDPLVAERTRYELRLQGDLSLRAASALAPLPPGTTLDGVLSADCTAQGRAADPESLQLLGTLAVRNASVTSPQTRQPVRIQADARLTGDALRIDDVQLAIGGSTARLQGRAAPLRAGVVPDLHLEGTSTSLDLDAILPTPPTTPAADGSGPTPGATSTRRSLLPPHPPGRVDLTLDIGSATYQLARWSGIGVQLDADPQGFSVQARVDSMQRDALHLRSMRLSLQGDSLQAEGKLEAARSRLGRVNATQLRSQVEVRGTLVSLPEMAAGVYDGMLKGQARLDLSDPQKPHYEMDLEMQSVEAGALLADVLPGGQWMTGTLQGKSSWSSTGAAPQVLRSNLSASGNAMAASGRLYRFPLVDALVQTLNMKEVPTISYQDLDMRFAVEGGRVQIPQLQLTGSDLTASSHGSVGLAGDVDLDLNVVLTEEQTQRYLRGDLGRTVKQLFADPEGRIVLDFNVGGTLKAPRLQADLQSTAARQGLRSLGSQEIGRLLDDVLPGKDSDLGDALRRGLGDLLGGKKESAADSTRQR